MEIINHERIYKRDSKGKIRVWWIERTGSAYRTNAGIKDGSIVTSNWTEVKPHNVGRSNETNHIQQTLLEVESEYRKKLSQGAYYDNIADIDNVGYVQPMLAYKWGERKIKPSEWGNMYSQPKLNGMRCIASEAGMFSRRGKPIVSVPHIWEELQPYFRKNPGVIFDGELYNHDLKEDFETIMSICRKSKLSSIDLEQSKLIQYHTYDLPSVPLHNFKERDDILEDILGDTNQSDVIQKVLTDTIENEEHLHQLFQQYLRWKYEGQMVRMNEPYSNKRSKALMKHKEFINEEFTIVDIVEGIGNWSGHAKSVTCAKQDGTKFGAGIKGNKAFAKKLLEDADLYRGGETTIEFFCYTNNNIPYLPVAIDFHQKRRID
jgi:DNA ligase-1